VTGPRPALTEHAAVGKAASCQAYPRSLLFRSHKPSRFVWHHVLPQVCGGLTEPANLVSLCDNCHYAAHYWLYQLACGGTLPRFKTAVMRFALQGYERAVAAGTAGKIPREA